MVHSAHTGFKCLSLALPSRGSYEYFSILLKAGASEVIGGKAENIATCSCLFTFHFCSLLRIVAVTEIIQMNQ
jgi:hypothetical protein